MTFQTDSTRSRSGIQRDSNATPSPARPDPSLTRDERCGTPFPTQHRSFTEQGCREPGYAARMVLEHLRDKAELESGGFARYVSLICRTALGEKR